MIVFTYLTGAWRAVNTRQEVSPPCKNLIKQIHRDHKSLINMSTIIKNFLLHAAGHWQGWKGQWLRNYFNNLNDVCEDWPTEWWTEFVYATRNHLEIIKQKPQSLQPVIIKPLITTLLALYFIWFLVLQPRWRGNLFISNHFCEA